MADASSRPRSYRQRLLLLLTQSSHISAPFITTFLLIHLSAPVMANVGGSSLSSQVMLLGREYYQTTLGETYLVLGPLAVHALSGIIRRTLIIYPKVKSSSNSSTILQRIRRALPATTLCLTAYTVLLILPIHFGTHRLLPTTTTPPVLSLGPSELDYSFVQYGLQRWPVRTWAMYTVLVGATITHAVEGLRILMSSRSDLVGVSEQAAADKSSSNSFFPTNSRIRRRLLVAILTLPVLSGLYVLYEDPLYVFTDMGRRLEGVYQLSWIYSTQ
ncbi:hypothetical protein J3R30DRAFT_576205 [Lentinula aciculospora]|uniref:Mitochondrial adapter protein MCP1 transmembrane domain-containing protein n=1 Tax=Lentinula aciculospora TaxID=153920 RepID=A0A9W9A7R2_9AGAR|nr:hypothetical protein J3R30DRAFT_576205 [Lentinula aciculospora]